MPHFAMISRNTSLIEESTITWNGSKTYDYVEIPISDANGLVLYINNTSCSSVLLVTFEHEVDEGEWVRWCGESGFPAMFSIPANTTGVYGPFKNFPKYLGGRIKLTADSAPTADETSLIQAQAVS